MLRRKAGEILTKSPNDVVVLSAVRSPITRAYKGGFKDAYPEDILMPVSQVPPILFSSDRAVINWKLW